MFVLEAIKQNDNDVDSDMEQIFDTCTSGWWFQIFLIFTPTWGRFPF